MEPKVRQVVLSLFEDDCKWLEKVYGKEWMSRIEQHIHAEVILRSRDALSNRKPWDY
jgi:hypothetical protein